VNNKKLQEILKKFPDDLDVVIWHDIDDNNNIDWVDESGAKGKYKELVIATDHYTKEFRHSYPPMRWLNRG
jgi:hypothetical protein